MVFARREPEFPASCRPGGPVRPATHFLAGVAALAAVSVLACGCTSVSQYVQNGFKVGPNYSPPPAPVAKDWIDAGDIRVRRQSDDLSRWWSVFHDPALDSLVCYAYRQNLSLRAAGFRVLEARAQMLIDVGNLFPQTQAMTGDFTRNALSRETANSSFIGRRWYSQWDYGFNLSWELDFWGRFRRAVEADSATLDASVFGYDDVLVTLLGDVATNYVEYRTTGQRIRYAQENVALQRKTLEIAEGEFKAGVVGEVDVAQARSTLEQTEAAIHELEIAQRQYANALCTLLGLPPQEVEPRLGWGPIPTAPPEVALGIPAELLARRPDVRQAERLAAAQCAQIGVAQAEFYPHISINGTIGVSAERFKDLFREGALAGNVGPSFTWNILNYGRIVNNVRYQDARFQELVATYQNTVLSANQDVENGLVQFLRAQQRARSQAAAVADADKAVQITLAQYTAGTTDLTRVTLLQQNLVTAEDTLAQAEGEIALGLIQVYRAMGGGWQIRLTGCQPGPLPPSAAATPEVLPTPVAAPNPAPRT
jgi:NodT family efflux transporter outer membrane factor (OMF) lipoprotein